MASGLTFQNPGVPPHRQPQHLPPPPQLPISQLESLKFKSNQIIESIITLIRTLDGSLGPAYVPPWPEILSKYNVILSQTHNFSNALLNPYPTGPGAAAALAASRASGSSNNRDTGENIYQKIVVHPNMGLPDAQMEDFSKLLRNQQTLDVLKQENETVRRLSEHMSTRGMLGVLGITPSTTDGGAGAAAAAAAHVENQNYLQMNGFRGLNFAPPPKPEYEDVLQECAEIRGAHDRRVERAVRAVAMLQERFNRLDRVEVEQEEPEELDWNSRPGQNEDDGMGSSSDDDDGDDGDEDEHGDGGGRGSSNDEDDVDDIQGELVMEMEELDRHSSPPPPATPTPTTMPQRTFTPTPTRAPVAAPVPPSPMPPAPVFAPPPPPTQAQAQAPAPPTHVFPPVVHSIDDDDEPEIVSMSQTPSQAAAPAQTQGPRPDIEIIDLT